MMYDKSIQEQKELEEHAKTGRPGLFWNNGPSLYFHQPFGLRITPYGACKTLEERIPWNPETRFFCVEDVGSGRTFYGSMFECAMHTGANRKTIKKKSKTGGLYRGRYSIGEVDFREFVEKTGRTMTNVRRFSERY